MMINSNFKFIWFKKDAKYNNESIKQLLIVIDMVLDVNTSPIWLQSTTG